MSKSTNPATFGGIASNSPSGYCVEERGTRLVYITLPDGRKFSTKVISAELNQSHGRIFSVSVHSWYDFDEMYSQTCQLLDQWKLSGRDNFDKWYRMKTQERVDQAHSRERRWSGKAISANGPVSVGVDVAWNGECWDVFWCAWWKVKEP